MVFQSIFPTADGSILPLFKRLLYFTWPYMHHLLLEIEGRNTFEVRYLIASPARNNGQ